MKKIQMTNFGCDYSIENTAAAYVKKTNLFLDTIDKLGCIYYESDEERTIVFNYLGESFTAYILCDTDFVTILDNSFEVLEGSDEDDKTKMREIVNDLNGIFDISVYYDVSKEDGSIHISASTKILFIEEIPEIDIYLKSILNDFLRLKKKYWKQVGYIECYKEYKDQCKFCAQRGQ